MGVVFAKLLPRMVVVSPTWEFQPGLSPVVCLFAFFSYFPPQTGSFFSYATLSHSPSIPARRTSCCRRIRFVICKCRPRPSSPPSTCLSSNSIFTGPHTQYEFEPVYFFPLPLLPTVLPPFFFFRQSCGASRFILHFAHSLSHFSSLALSTTGPPLFSRRVLRRV